MHHLEKDLRQRSKIRRHESERARQRGDVPKRQHFRRYEDDERQDHNTNTPFEFRHSQENNKTLTEAQVCYAHMAEEERNKQNRRSEGGDNLEVTQKGTHMEFDLDNRTWNAINSMNNIKSNFAPKKSRNFGREKESTNNVKNMMKFSFGSTILLRGTWTS